MLLGYIFDFFQAITQISGSEGVDNSGPLEEFAKKQQVLFELLNFDEVIFGVSIPDQLSIKEFSTLKKKHRDSLNKLRQALINAGLEPGELNLIADPQWSRHGEPLTFG